MSQSPDLDPTTPAPAGASLPAFLPPSPSPRSRRRPSSPRAADPTQGIPTPPPLDDDEDGDDFDSLDDSAEGSYSPASTEPAPEARFRPIDPSTRKMYAAAVEKGAVIASGLVNARLDPEGRSFVMRQEEAEGVAAPASRLLARHVPLSAAMAGQATDLSDIVELATALVGYVMGAMARRAGGYEAGSGMPDGTEGDVSDWRTPDPTTGEMLDQGPAPAPMPAWPMPAGMAPMVGSGSM